MQKTTEPLLPFRDLPHGRDKEAKAAEATGGFVVWSSLCDAGASLSSYRALRRRANERLAEVLEVLNHWTTSKMFLRTFHGRVNLNR